MNLIVVDDNKVELREICRVIESVGLDVQISGTFYNGKDAFDYLQSHEVDVIVSDVQMPMMDGIELVKAVKSAGMMSEVILVSCYDDFEYVKEAFRSEAFDYILKPIVKTDFKRTIVNAFEKCTTKKNVEKHRQQIAESMVRLKPMIRDEYYRQKLASDAVGQENDDALLQILGIPQDKPWVTVAKAKIMDDSAFQEDSPEPDLYFGAMIYLKNAAQELSSEDLDVYSVIQEGDRIALIMFSGDPEWNVLDSIAKFKTNLLLSLGLEVSFGVSDTIPERDKLGMLNRQADMALTYSFSNSKSSIVQYSEIDGVEESPMDVSDMLETVRLLLNDGDKEQLEPFVREYLDEEADNWQNMQRVASRMLYCLELVLVDYTDTLESHSANEVRVQVQQCHTAEELTQLLCKVLGQSIDLIHGTDREEETGKQRIIAQIKEIVAQQYHTKITVNAIAEELHFSAKYISLLFQDMENKSIFEYITEYRIEMAKQMLKEPGSKVYKVVGAVGYTSKSHFYDIFKSYVGISPMEYKNIYGK